jgi:cytochrome c2
VRRTTFAAALLALAAAGAAQDSRDQGRALFLAKGCVHCHREATSGALTAQSPAGPDLREAGQRLRASWLRSWLRASAAPHALAEDAVDAAAYLASLGGPFRAGKRRGDAARGARLFVLRGCAACHAPGALDGLAAKTGFGPLVDYLRAPLRVHPRGLMPDLGLDNDDAEDIAAHLLADVAEPPPELAAGAAARGAAIVAARRCAACHELPDAVRAADAPLLEAIRGRAAGCLAEEPPATVPHYGLSVDERLALVLFLRDPHRPEPGDRQRTRRLAELRCLSCHRLERAGGLPAAVATAYHALTEAGAAELTDPPPLDDLASRLRPDYVRAVLAGEERARPWLEMRMPRYAPQLVDGLAELLVDTPPAATADHRRADIENGRLLAGAGGLGCITCHDFAGLPAAARGPDLTRLAARLQPAWIERWLRDPSALRPGTRMPTFFAGGRSAAAAILDGAADAQIAALLAYLGQGERMMPPDGLGPPPRTRLAPDAGPLVWRTILPDLPPRALAIGFQDGLSVAFDLQTPRLGYAWQGGFLDMRRKWNGRGDGPADLVGGRALDGPPGAAFDRSGIAFAGHALDANGVTLVFADGAREVQLRLSTVACSAGIGLRLQLDNGFEAPLRFALGTAAGSEPALAAGGAQLLALRASPGVHAYAAGTTLELDEIVRLHTPAAGSARATLWLLSSTREEALVECLSR